MTPFKVVVVAAVFDWANKQSSGQVLATLAAIIMVTKSFAQYTPINAHTHRVSERE